MKEITQLIGLLLMLIIKAAIIIRKRSFIKSMVFTKYRVMSNDNTESTVSGTVHYTDNTWSRQSGLGHSSGGKIETDGSGVDYKAVFDNSGYQDKFSFSASGATLYSFSGWCIPKNGIRYEF